MRCCLTAEQGPVEGELLRQVFDVCDALVHCSGQMICMIQAAQDDAGEVDGLGEVAHQRALDTHHIPSAPKHTGKQQVKALLHKNTGCRIKQRVTTLQSTNTVQLII